MIENKRRKFHHNIECVPTGFANGSALDRPLTDEEKKQMIEEAAEHFGKFLDALKCDWRNDPNSMETPHRVAKKYLEQWAGRYNAPPEITSFPSDGYKGMVLQTNIPLTSVCSHHHETILGRVHIAYIPGNDARVIGLSKLNRIVEHFGRRGAIQEQLTMAIHQAVDKVCEGNIGVAVTIVGEHQCVSCRGTNHKGSTMVTNHLTGVFIDKSEVRSEYFKSIELVAYYKQNM
jgi:GTP cyclohydrolase I